MPPYPVRPSILLLGAQETLADLYLLLETDFDIGAATTFEDLLSIAELIRFDVLVVMMDEAFPDPAALAPVRALPRYQGVSILACSPVPIDPTSPAMQAIDGWMPRATIREHLLDLLQGVLD